jgi:AmmeMemoRadiSam system protein A
MMKIQKLTAEEQQTLLKLARQALNEGVSGKALKPLELSMLPPALREEGASFVTLTMEGMLRGCIGTLQPYQPLAEDVREHAVAAATEDPRFPPVRLEEVTEINIEISRLSPAQPLEYEAPEDLLGKLRPHVDGVIARDGFQRATFLPQVWEKIPDPAEFMDNLCYKMGVDPHAWRHRHLDIQIYEVEEFHE